MNTQLLPSIVASPFSKRFHANNGTYCGSDAIYPSQVDSSPASCPPFRLHYDSDSYSNSETLNVDSSPWADKNVPSVTHGHTARSVLTKIDNSSDGYKPWQGRRRMAPKVTRSALSHLHAETEPTPLRDVLGRHRAAIALVGEKKIGDRTQAGPSLASEACRMLDTHVSRDVSSSENADRGKDSLQQGAQAQEYNSLDQSPQELHGISLQLDNSGNTPIQYLSPFHHKKHLSTASSHFVHTIKTASLSNASFSLAARSIRFGHSTDNSGIFNSIPRRSVDSERPPTSASVDEAAFRRAIKRRQIFLELVMTEESYIADLKALIYLYSTLLATSVTVSNRVRSAILRNVHDLLHVHERLLERLHQAAYDAAARKWADTTSPRHLGSPRYHKRWKSLESKAAVRFGRGHQRTRSSMDSVEVCRGRSYLGGAEPQDATDLCKIFRESLNDFLVYEEYCANHSLVSHELQRHAPTHWSTYESGMESLARSLIALDQKSQNARKCLTVGDLLIKPIQRMTKYPLLFDDLLRHTPVADCPSSHSELEATLMCLKEMVQMVNKAADNWETRDNIQRRWCLQTRLIYDKVSLRAEQFRMLGNVQLCGVLHVVWQTRNGRVDGRYALCVLFDNSFIVALPAGATARFEVIAFLHLPDIKVESPSNGRGLQCHSTLHTWKLSFETGGHLHELILSACSSIEESAWKTGLASRELPVKRTNELFNQIPSSIGLDLRSVGQVYSQQSSTLSRNPSVQRAATVGNRPQICQVIVRNTHNPEDLGEFRQPSSTIISRSQSHLTSNRVVVLAPKRSERARLEATLSDVWTRGKLPYPGMIGSRGGQIIRASAGSLVRKLSLASLQAPFSRRSASVSLTSRKSFDVSTDGHRSRIKPTPVFEIRKESLEEGPTSSNKPRDIPEVDTMDTVISRMIGGSNISRRLSLSHGDHNLRRKGTKPHKSGPELEHEIRPEDPAEIFYSEEKDVPEVQEIVEEGLSGKKKRWSKPLGILKVLSGDGFRHMLYSTK